MQILIPDLDATIEVDPVEAALRHALATAIGTADKLTGDDQAAANLGVANLQTQLDEYLASKDARMMIRVGYIKPAKFVELKFRLAGAQEKAQAERKIEAAAGEASGIAKWAVVTEALLDVYRDICKHGLKGWNLKEPAWVTEVAVIRGRNVEVAHEQVIEAIEQIGWLPALALKVLEYNTLSEDSKKK